MVDLERAYATIIMVIGATVFGYIVGSVSALASNPNGSQARETFKILRVSNYLDEKKVQQKLRQVCIGTMRVWFLKTNVALVQSGVLSVAAGVATNKGCQWQTRTARTRFGKNTSPLSSSRQVGLRPAAYC